MTRAFAPLLAAVALLVVGCEPEEDCPSDETLLVEETGSCAATPQRFTVSIRSCGITLEAPQAATGLPAAGALDMAGHPFRQGGFLLYGGGPEFRLCRARRVEFRLELACLDSRGEPVCDAVLTEPKR